MDAERRSCGQTAASCSLVNLHRSQLRDNATHPVLFFEAIVQKVAWNWLFFVVVVTEILFSANLLFEKMYVDDGKDILN